jgi:hypothetical protein
MWLETGYYVSGHPLQVQFADGTTSQAQFPRLISPEQIVSNVRGLAHTVAAGVDVSITFEGTNTCEMEDQRQARRLLFSARFLPVPASQTWFLPNCFRSKLKSVLLSTLY